MIEGNISSNGPIAIPLRFSQDISLGCQTLRAVAAPLLSFKLKHNPLNYIYEQFEARGWSVKVLNDQGEAISKVVAEYILFSAKPENKALRYPENIRSTYEAVIAERNALTAGSLASVLNKEINLPNREEKLFNKIPKIEVMPLFLRTIKLWETKQIESWGDFLTNDVFCLVNADTFLSGKEEVKAYFNKEKFLNQEINFYAYNKGSIFFNSTWSGYIEATGETLSYQANTQLFFRNEEGLIRIFGLVQTFDSVEAGARQKAFKKKNEGAPSQPEKLARIENYELPENSRKLKKLYSLLATKSLVLVVDDEKEQFIPYEFQEAVLKEIKKSHIASKYPEHLLQTYIHLKNRLRKLSVNQFVSDALGKRYTLLNGTVSLNEDHLNKNALKIAYYTLVDYFSKDKEAFYDQLNESTLYLSQADHVSVGRENIRRNIGKKLAYTPSLISRVCGVYIKGNSVTGWTQNRGNISAEKNMHFSEITTFIFKPEGDKLSPYLINNIQDRHIVTGRIVSWIFRNTLRGGPALGQFLKNYFSSSKPAVKPIEREPRQIERLAPSADQIHVAKGKRETSKKTITPHMEASAKVEGSPSPISVAFAAEEI